MDDEPKEIVVKPGDCFFAARCVKCGELVGLAMNPHKNPNITFKDAGGRILAKCRKCGHDNAFRADEILSLRAEQEH